MKKFVAIISVLTLIISCNITAVASANEKKEEREDTYSDIVKYIIPNYSIDTEYVTRADFVKYTVRTKFSCGETAVTGYSDVDEFDNASGEIAYARSLNIIDKNELFFPNLPVTLTQASKIAVGVLGYGEFAGANNGGYLRIADELKLFEGITADKYLNKEQMTRFLYNMLDAPLLKTKYENGCVSYSMDNESSLLYNRYGIKKIEGKETANWQTGLTEIAASATEGSVNIDSVPYEYEGKDFIGYNIYGFYDEKDMKLITMCPYKNDEITIDCRDIENIKNNIIEYSEGDKLKRVKINTGFSCIYNYKAYEKDGVFGMMLNGEGILKLIDNDRNGYFDVIYFIKTDYLITKTVDTYDMLISGDYAERGIIDLSGDDVSYEILKKNEKITLNDLKANDLLSYSVSLDNKYYTINVLTSEITAVISSVDREDRVLKTSEGDIKYNKYFENYYLNDVVLGNEYDFSTDEYGRACCLLNDASDFLYGWIMRKYNDDDGEGVLRILTETGKAEDFRIPERLGVDGVVLTAEADIEKAFSSLSDANRLIRYCADEDGYLKKVDFAQEAEGELPFNKNKKDNDFLTRYYSNVSATYVQNGKIMSPYYRMSDRCSVFVIPKSEEKRNDINNYHVENPGYFANNGSYTTTVYDISREDGARAVVLFDDEMTLGLEDASAVVESVENTVNEDGESVIKVTILMGSKFTTLTAKEEIQEKAKALNPGDIIKLKSGRDDTLLEFNKEYDVLNDNLLAPASEQVKYRKGFLYDYSGGFITILEKDSLSSYSYKNMSVINPGNVVISHIYVTMDKNGKVTKTEVRLQPDYTLKSYLSTGEMCDRIITRQRYAVLGNIWIYHIVRNN